MRHISAKLSMIGLCTSMHALLTSETYWVSSLQPAVHCDLFHMLMVHVQSGTYKGKRTIFML